jgi:hypothetical protein
MNQHAEARLMEIGAELQALRDERDALVATASTSGTSVEERRRGQEVIRRIHKLLREADGLRKGAA